MKICYIPRIFSESSEAIIGMANGILLDYAEQGYDLTLRQLYYQFVSRALIANKDSEYKRLGSIINDARLAGRIDWDHITDRTRSLRQNAHWDSPREIIAACADQFERDKWNDQATYIEVWVEKDALVGVLEVACKPLDVAYFSCRGYTSQSEMWVAAMRLVQKAKKGKKIVVIHLGDHDPSGVDMSRDILDRLCLFMRHDGCDDPVIRRIALNMDQVRQYNPPPNPAKITDSRAVGYMREHGGESWELDALEPAVITELIREVVESLRDEDLWNEQRAIEERGRRQLTDCAARWSTLFSEPDSDDGSGQEDDGEDDDDESGDSE